jgi:hypothetical protein
MGARIRREGTLNILADECLDGLLRDSYRAADLYEVQVLSAEDPTSNRRGLYAQPVRYLPYCEHRDFAPYCWS